MSETAGNDTIAPRVVGKLCTLEYALGRIEPCPRSSRCPFWEEGGAVLESGCMLERFLPAEDWTPELAAHWLRVRRAAERRYAQEARSPRFLLRLRPLGE